MMLTLRVNAREHTIDCEPRTHLGDLVRDTLLLTGTHLGCEHGVCGACTVMLDGQPVRSCLTLAATCAGADVRTIEGFDDDALMAALRAAFSRHHSLQCGYCTPGMLVTAYDIVRRLPNVEETLIRIELGGNLCRCTGYVGIVAAIAEVARSGIPAAVRPIRRTVIATTPALPSPRLSAFGSETRPWSEPDLAGATVLRRRLDLPLSVADTWRLLRTIGTVVNCMPGAALDRLDGEEAEGSLTVAIGPMRASFRGRACIRYDDAARTGTVTGGALDPTSRSSAQGALRFHVAAAAAGCTVEVGLSYRLTGPLSQVGRPVIVAGIVDQMVGHFTANLLAAATGQAVDGRPLRGVRLALGVLRSAIRRILQKRA